jgi:predicted PurR-regulated permease PerM
MSEAKSGRLTVPAIPDSEISEEGDGERTPRIGEVARPAPDAAWWRAAAIAASALALAIAAVALVWLLARPLALLFAAIVLAVALAPIADRLEQSLPRPFAVALTYIVLGLATAALGWLVVPSLAGQAQALVLNMPGLVAQGRSLIDLWDPSGSDQIAQIILNRLDRLAITLVSLPLAIASSVIEIGLVFIMSAYWLISAPALHRFTLSLPSPHNRVRLETLLKELDETVGGFARGELVAAAVMMVITFLGLHLIGVQFPLVLALLSGLGELIPILGPFIAAVPAIGIALLHSPAQALVVAAFYLITQQIESNLLVPRVMRRQANIPPVLAIFALIAGQALGGILGALIAIPLAGVIRVLVLHVAAPAIREWSGGSAVSHDGMTPGAS